jgi:hypothetical protein
MEELVAGGEKPGPRDSAPSFLSDDHHGVTVLRLVGEHDMASADALECRIDSEMGAGKDVVVSLQDITL